MSDLNTGNSVDGIPGLNTRAVQTTVDLREGQWLAIAGLIKDRQTGDSDQLPFFGDIPILRAFLRNRKVSRTETELIVLVSPELVHPMDAQDVPLFLPGMEVTEPNDCELYAGGRIEGRDGCYYRSTVMPKARDEMIDQYKAQWHRKMHPRYQQCEKYYIHGPNGFTR